MRLQSLIEDMTDFTQTYYTIASVPGGLISNLRTPLGIGPWPLGIGHEMQYMLFL